MKLLGVHPKAAPREALTSTAEEEDVRADRLKRSGFPWWTILIRWMVRATIRSSKDASDSKNDHIFTSLKLDQELNLHLSTEVANEDGT